MKRFLLAVVALVAATASVFAQGGKDEVRFYVMKATIDGVDVTKQIEGKGVYTVFYEQDGEIYMANVWEATHSQSWGPIRKLRHKSVDATDKEYSRDEYLFEWSYKNTYDKEKGVCKVLLSKVYTPNGVVSVLKILQKSGELTEYVGYMDGSLDLPKTK